MPEKGILNDRALYAQKKIEIRNDEDTIRLEKKY